MKQDKPRQHQKTNRVVLQFTIKGRLIRQFYSISEASRQTNIGRTNISNSLANQSGIKTAGGYVWDYKSKYTNERFDRIRLESKI